MLCVITWNCCADIANQAAIYDTQRRAIEHIQIVQLQIEALGAPSPDDAITGQYEKIDLSKLTAGSAAGDSGKGSSNM